MCFGDMGGTEKPITDFGGNTAAHDGRRGIEPRFGEWIGFQIRKENEK